MINFAYSKKCYLRLTMLLFSSSTLSHTFLTDCLFTLPMSDDRCMWESVQHPAAASRLLYFMGSITGFCHLNYLEVDEQAALPSLLILFVPS